MDSGVISSTEDSVVSVVPPLISIALISIPSFTVADTIPEVVLAKIPKVNKTATAPLLNFLIANCDFVDLNIFLPSSG